MKFNFYFFEMEVIVGFGILKNKIRREYREYGKIHAIKLHRNITKSSLLEAKNYVERVCEDKS